MILKTFTKINISCLLLFFCILNTQGLIGQNHPDRAPATENDQVITSPGTPGVMAMWDLAFDFNVSAGPNLLGLAGAIHIGDQFWVAVWSGDTLARYENDGTYIEKFAIPELFDDVSGGIRAMTWDSTNIWAANNTNQIHQIDTATKTVINSVTVTGTSDPIRFITYDKTADNGNGGFWVGNFNTPIALIDMNGVFISSIPAATHNLGGMYGAAIDNESPDGPYLWVFHQAGTPTDGLITQLKLSDGMPTGISRDVNIDLNTPGALAGGLFISNSWDVNGGMILGGIAQTNPDRLFGYELDFVPSAAINASTSDFTSPVTACNLSDAEMVTFDINNVGEVSLTDIPGRIISEWNNRRSGYFYGYFGCRRFYNFYYATTFRPFHTRQLYFKCTNHVPR